ncbi:MAG: hypothetical protein F6K58_31150 [Symploca sp. SIO2E9]|nr:hypothetical protein [Symploca sp. SIO2E9]
MNGRNLLTFLEAGTITIFLLLSFRQLDQAATFTSKTTTDQFNKSVTEGSMLLAGAALTSEHKSKETQQNFLMKLFPSSDSVALKLTSDASCQNY